jgi:hypothetical protein
MRFQRVPNSNIRRPEVVRSERRQQSRHALQVSAFAALGRTFTKVGRVNNICAGGLAFDYIAGRTTSDGDSFIDLFLTQNSFHLHGVPCRVVYDFEVQVHRLSDQFVFPLTTRRCGIQFSVMPQDCRENLKLFTDLCTLK